MRVRISDKAKRRHERRRWAVEVIATSRDEIEARKMVASVLGVSRRTLRRWLARWRRGRLAPRALGRPRKWGKRSDRQGVIATLFALGRSAAVKAVRAMHSKVSYRVIGEMKRRLLRAKQRRAPWYLKRLEWIRAGSVWAMDFTKPKARLSRGNTRLFCVRDLASGYRLASVPCVGERASVADRVLKALFALFRAPLVLKRDNGSAFRAGRVRSLLREHGVTTLASPTYWPPYKGSCERSLGWLKIRAAHVAEIAGHAGTWNDGDVERARVQANRTLRTWGVHGPTPEEAFEKRASITKTKREAFKRLCRQNKRALLKTYEIEFGTMPAQPALSSIERTAIQNALCEQGYLHIRRGRMTTPL